MKERDIEVIKEFVKTQAGLYRDGVVYALVHKGTVCWQWASEGFEPESYGEGKRVENSAVEAAMKTRQTQSVTVSDPFLERKLMIMAVPVISDTEECESVLLTVVPVIHPLEHGFKHIAPVIAELFSEGSLITMTNTKEVLQVQRSEKYDISAVVPGFDVTQTEVVSKAMSTGKCVHSDDDTLLYGPPIRVLAAPYFDEETRETLGVINILRPKQTELSLKNLSSNLEKQLSEVLITVQEVAAASGAIHTNEQEINGEIEEITEMAEQIVQVSNLIKSIADSTKMLGLNASIEAARVGNLGKGFGVVAIEINKLSEQSKNTVPKIKKLTDDIKAKVEESKIKSRNSLATSQEQVAATEEITATIEDIQSASVELADIANTI